MLRKRLIGWGVGLLMAYPFAHRGIEALIPTSRPLDLVASAAGKELFEHEWTPGDPLAAGGDGLGPVFNARSCVECHRQGGIGGSGPEGTNVNVFTVRPSDPSFQFAAKATQGVVHTQAVNSEFQETFHILHSDLTFARPTGSKFAADARRAAGDHLKRVDLSQRRTPALFGAGLIDAIPDSEIIANERRQRLKWGMANSTRGDTPVGRALRMSDGRVGRFGWKGQTASLVDFVRAACANELGLGNPGQAQPAPLGRPAYQPVGYDLTLAQCDQLTEFVRSLPRPAERLPDDAGACANVRAGRQLFDRVGCAECHTPNVGSVEGLYSDLLLHELGQDLEAGGGYNDVPLDDPSFEPGAGPRPAEWRTPPLWGVASSAPYLHDGRAATLSEAIALHGGQGKESAQRFVGLAASEKEQLIAFLKTLEAP